MSETRNETLLFTQETETRQNYRGGGRGVYSPALADGRVSWAPSGHPITPFHFSPMRSPHTTVLHGCHRTTELAEPPTHTHTHTHAPLSSPCSIPQCPVRCCQLMAKNFRPNGTKNAATEKETSAPWEFRVFYTTFDIKKITTRSTQENVKM